VISEGSRDTEDWSNNAENSALITGINYTYIKIENSYFKLSIYLTILLFFIKWMQPWWAEDIYFFLNKNRNNPKLFTDSAYVYTKQIPQC